MPLPQITEPSVGATPLRVPEASPNVFGADVGQGVAAVGQAKLDQQINERHLAAAFDAQDRILKYGVEHDQLKQDYENRVRTLQADDATGFQEKITQLREQFAQEQESLRIKYANTLKDQLARKSYEIRTRVETQDAQKSLMLFSDAHLRAWRMEEGKKGMALNEERAGNSSGDLATDLGTLQKLRNSNADIAALQLHAGLVPGGKPAAEAALRASDRTMALNLLTAYDEKGNHEAALGFLASTLPDGTHVTYDPNDKDKENQKYLLTTSEAQKAINKFRDGRAEKVGASLGASWVLDPHGPKTYEAAKALAARMVKDGKIDEATGLAAAKIVRDDQDTRYREYEHARTLETQAALGDVASGKLTPEEAQKAHPLADLSQLYREGGRYDARAGRSVAAQLRSAMSDPQNAGFTLGLPRNVLIDDLNNKRVPPQQADAILREYDKAAKRDAAVGRVSNASVGLNVVHDTLRPVLGVNTAAGMKLDDLKQQWQRDVRDAAETEYYHRLGAAARANGAKGVSLDEMRQIATAVTHEIPEWKRRAKAGDKIVPVYPPEPTAQPSQDQISAGARVRSSIVGSMPVAQGTKITNGKDVGLLQPGFPMPDGWHEVK